MASRRWFRATSPSFRSALPMKTFPHPASGTGWSRDSGGCSCMISWEALGGEKALPGREGPPLQTAARCRCAPTQPEWHMCCSRANQSRRRVPESAFPSGDAAEPSHPLIIAPSGLRVCRRRHPALLLPPPPLHRWELPHVPRGAHFVTGDLQLPRRQPSPARSHRPPNAFPPSRRL